MRLATERQMRALSLWGEHHNFKQVGREMGITGGSAATLCTKAYDRIKQSPEHPLFQKAIELNSWRRRFSTPEKEAEFEACMRRIAEELYGPMRDAS